MTGDHPTDWALKYVKAKTLRDAADAMRAELPHSICAADWLRECARELEQR